jgi:hypothetical protein
MKWYAFRVFFCLVNSMQLRTKFLAELKKRYFLKSKSLKHMCVCVTISTCTAKILIVFKKVLLKHWFGARLKAWKWHLICNFNSFLFCYSKNQEFRGKNNFFHLTSIPQDLEPSWGNHFLALIRRRWLHAWISWRTSSSFFQSTQI